MLVSLIRPLINESNERKIIAFLRSEKKDKHTIVLSVSDRLTYTIYDEEVNIIEVGLLVDKLNKLIDSL